MATSIRDLVRTLEDEASSSTGTARQAADAAGALDGLGRALRRLADDGLELRVNGAREDIAKDLAASCADVAAASVLDPNGRLTGLAGAIGDFVGRLRDETGRDHRWAIATELANTVRVISTYAAEGDNRRTTELAWIHLTARALVARSIHDAPTAQGQAILDRAVPSGLIPADVAPARAAMESLTAISDRLRRVAAKQARPATLLEVFAVSRAAEASARYAAVVTAALADRPAAEALPASAIWYEVRNQLRPLCTVAPTRLEDRDLGVWAQRTREGLVRQFGPLNEFRSVANPSLTANAMLQLQTMINEVPVVADNLAESITQLADRGDLHALASNLNFREDRLEQFLARQAVVADRLDLEPVTRRLGDAADLAGSLAMQLDRAPRPGRPAHPALVHPRATRAAATRVDPHAALSQQVSEVMQTAGREDHLADPPLALDVSDERDAPEWDIA